MASILKVDTIQDQAGNNIISEAANIITIGASGDTITVPAGATVSGFTSAGIDDNATSVAITIDSSENVGIKSTTPSSDAWNGARTLVLKETSGDNGITIISSSATNNGNIAFADTSGGGFSDIGGLITYLHNGDSFRFMTANAERMRLNSTGLGIGTSSPTQKLDVNGTVKATAFEGDGSSLTGVTSVGGATGVDFNDNVKARFGTGNDLEIFHDGTNSKIKELGTGQLILDSNGAGINFTKSDAEYMARMYTDGAVELYYDNSKKFETTTNGVTITGGVNDSLRVTNDVDTSTNAPDIVLYRNSASPADDDNLGFLEFTGNQSNGNEHTYAYINAKAKDVTAGTEDAELEFAVSKAGTATIIASVTNAGFVPKTTDTYDLGSSSLVWRNIYTGDLHLSNEAKDEGNAVDGTKGNWTIQEGSEDLFIVNNKSGKKYKFKLEEI